jgi:transporter family-2 protein
MTWVAPRFGVGNAVAFVLLGQLISMALIDHFAWFDAAHYPITLQRVFGLVLMTAGVFFAVRR